MRRPLRAPDRGTRISGPRPRWATLPVVVLALVACAAPSSAPTAARPSSWEQVSGAARGQSVSLWMWGGDPQGNAYVDTVLAPAAKRLGITLRRVPVADTKDALNRVLSERQAGTKDGSVDLVWVNGDNFATGMQAGAWLCGWSNSLPNMRYTNPSDQLLTSDFGTPVRGCEAPWNKAQFTLVYNAATVKHPPTSIAGVLAWAEAHPGRFTYPAPPDFTGSVFIRQVLYATSGGHQRVPLTYNPAVFGALTPALWRALNAVRPSLWRAGATYPRNSAALDRLYADRQVDMTMTYGPATLTSLVAKGTFPASTRVLALSQGTVGNASFLAIPATSGRQAAAMAVANLALSPPQQLAKARTEVWGQFTVLDVTRLDRTFRAGFEQLPTSPVVPPYEVLSKNANPELSAGWVGPLDDGWRRHVLAASP